MIFYTEQEENKLSLAEYLHTTTKKWILQIARKKEIESYRIIEENLFGHLLDITEQVKHLNSNKMEQEIILNGVLNRDLTLLFTPEQFSEYIKFLSTINTY